MWSHLSVMCSSRLSFLSDGNTSSNKSVVVLSVLCFFLLCSTGLLLWLYCRERSKWPYRTHVDQDWLNYWKSRACAEHLLLLLLQTLFLGLYFLYLNQYCCSSWLYVINPDFREKHKKSSKLKGVIFVQFQ